MRMIVKQAWAVRICTRMYNTAINHRQSLIEDDTIFQGECIWKIITSTAVNERLDFETERLPTSGWSLFYEWMELISVL